LKEKKYFLAVAPFDSWLAFPSGSAVYVFEENGKLTDWTSDNGEDGRFVGKWCNLRQERITLDELKTSALKGRK